MIIDDMSDAASCSVRSPATERRWGVMNSLTEVESFFSIA
jgi:hypothetical protein